ncbi:MAG: DUF5715 family protein [Actinomycetota bacterium]
MAELSHDASSCLVCRAKAEAPRRLGQGAALFAAGLCITSGALGLEPAVQAARPIVEIARPVITHLAPPVRHTAAVSAAQKDAAAATLEHGAAISFGRAFFTSGDVFDTATRVAQWHPQIVRAARAAHVDASTLEAIVFVESSGRPAVTNGAAVGLTQLKPSIARRYGLHVDTRRAAVLTRRIARSWSPAHIRQLARWRARYDERYSPAKELRASARYLADLEHSLGRDDLAVEAYHDGIASLRGIHTSYASLWFRTDSVGTYAFRVLAAERLLRMYRHEPSALRFEAQQQLRKNSAEEYLHPRKSTTEFATPGAILHAELRHRLRMIPVDTPRTHVAVSGTLGQEARKLGRARRLYRALRPQALDVLLYIGARVHELSGARKPLLLTSAVRDDRYQRVLMRVNVNAARTYSLHTTGFAFDIARAYASRRESYAFQRVLDELQAANAIAYIREAAAIHVAVAADAPAKLKLLRALDA